MNAGTRIRSLAIPLIAAILLFGIFAVPAHAQFSSGFTGVVVEQSSGAIPGAKVTVTNQDTHIVRSTVSTGTGDFRVPSLAEGTYTVEIEAAGFKTWIEKNIALDSNQIKTINPTLALSTQTTTVEVTAAEASVETDKSDTSVEISEQSMHDAPLLGRNIYTSMIQLAPGVTGSGLLAGIGSGSNNNDSFEQEPAYQINAAGQRQENNEYDVDGSIVVSASRDGVVNLTPESDFIQAMSVSGATFGAAKGRYSGAYVQVFTKPGTDQFHGSASEFFTNNNLSARTIFQTCQPEPACPAATPAVPPFQRNEFGGAAGGPIIKNKLFVFGGMFGLISNAANSPVDTVETPQFVQFVQANFPNNMANQFFGQAPPAGNVPLTNILTVAQVEQQTPGFYPNPIFPSDLPAEGTGVFTQSLTHNAYQWHFRVDYNVNESKDRLFFDWFRTYSNQLQADARPIYRVEVPNFGAFGKLDWTHAFSTTILNEAGFTMVRARGSQPSTAHSGELPNVSINGIGDGFSQWGPSGWVHENFDWHDVLSWAHGKHTITGGMDIDRHHDDDNFTNGLIRPNFSFANLVDFAQDQPFSQSGPVVFAGTGQQAGDLYQVIRWLYEGAFVQDDWKVTPRLTLNLGVRYDYFGHWGNEHNSSTPFEWFATGAGSDFAQQVANGSMVLKGGKEAYVTANRPQGWSPRLGFGWDVFGDGKTALRGGYGLFYNVVADGSWSFPSQANPPIYASPSFSLFSASHPFSYAFGNQAGTEWQVPQGISYAPTPAGGISGVQALTSGVQPQLDQPRTHVWMLAVQHDLGHNFAIEADYNGSHSDHLFLQTDVNRFPDDLIINGGVQTRLNSSFGPIIYGRTIGIADGAYGTVMLSKRFSQSWQLRSIFTFGKATDDTSSNDNGTNNGEAVFNPLYIQGQHALADFDVSKRLTLDSVVEIPTPFKSGLAKAVLGGWRMSNIVVLQSGLPFTVYTSAPFNPIIVNGQVVGVNVGSGDYNADGYDYDTPNAAPKGSVFTGNRTNFIKGFASASAFPVPALGMEGDLGRNSLIGPGLANVSTEFAKVFKIKERFSLEIRADVFNLFNRVNLTQPVSDVSSSQFGMSTSQTLPRSEQFGVHLDF
jgi:hypothetical protein